MADVWVVRFVSHVVLEGVLEDLDERDLRNHLLDWGIYAASSEERAKEQLVEWARDAWNEFRTDRFADSHDVRIDTMFLKAEDSSTMYLLTLPREQVELGVGTIRRLQLDK